MTKKKYQCTTCRSTFHQRFSSRCPYCGEWETNGPLRPGDQ